MVAGWLSLVSSPLGNDMSFKNLPRPEHPRPDRVRNEWLNLNGPWEFAETDNDDDLSWVSAPEYPDTIIVPFCRESELSGLNRKGFVRNVWYRKTVVKPEGWTSKRILLHIGACDWKTTVYINGEPAKTHLGGSTPIIVDLTDALNQGPATIAVHAFDDVRSGKQAGGKQSNKLESYGCLYTRTTGIWQTVWLEGVGSTYIESYAIEPQLHAGKFSIRPRVAFGDANCSVRATVFASGNQVAQAEASAGWRDIVLDLPLSDVRPWSIETPFLYDILLEVLRNGEVLDEVKTYCGLRSVSIDGQAVLINGKTVFQRLVLDQGFYPDGIWTAPSEEALIRDIELSQSVGFNGARLHEKVFEPLFLYHADRLGYLVWGEFPNWGLNSKDRDIDLPVIGEWTEIVARDRNHPAIIGWCPFNETVAEMVPLQNTVVNLTRQMDPSRPVIDTSGYVHDEQVCEILDDHDYEQDPAKFGEKWSTHKADVPFFVSEYGGIAWSLKEGGWGYGNAPTTIEEFYSRLKGLTDVLLDNRYHFGFCYTQLTDVEQEQNGIFTYNREPKFDCARIKSYLSRPAAYEQNPPLR